ncbi:MAG TPA: response regulator transcription factor [Gaiellaceae bacterium]|jgi:DNA-binding NarL/FixJ family response regulator|nr:response regulator transcription factor [Gaiellaceae bacterium]
MRLVLADDSVILREGLARLLGEQGFEVVAQVGTAPELLAVVARLEPDLAIIDIRMPPSHTDEGLVAAEELRTRHPTVGVLVLSQYVEAEYALRLLERGERGAGYLLKDRVLNMTDLADAVRRVGDGGSVIDPTLVEQLVQRPSANGGLEKLTQREREVLTLMAQGLSDRGIAQRLVVTHKTVETHVRHIFSKLDLPRGAAENRRVHAVLAFLRER